MVVRGWWAVELGSLVFCLVFGRKRRGVDIVELF